MQIRLTACSLAVTLLLLGQTAIALPGSHAPAISSYDTRASSVVLAYRHGASSAGPFDTFSYNANFSSTARFILDKPSISTSTAYQELAYQRNVFDTLIAGPSKLGTRVRATALSTHDCIDAGGGDDAK